MEIFFCVAFYIKSVFDFSRDKSTDQEVCDNITLVLMFCNAFHHWSSTKTLPIVEKYYKPTHVIFSGFLDFPGNRNTMHKSMLSWILGVHFQDGLEEEL